MSQAVALVHGADTSIGREVTAILEHEQIQVAAFDGNTAPGEEEISGVVQRHGRLDYLFNCFVPSHTTEAGEIFDYPRRLHERCALAAKTMAGGKWPGAIVNQWFTGTLHAGTPLEASLLIGKGALTGATRQICCAFGKSGVRINTIQAGLTELEENDGLVTPHTMLRKPPAGRWAKPSEVAKFMLFMALRSTYMSGQVICFDGGLTAGNTGT